MSNIQIQRVRVAIRGAVQGVGFRPFIFRLAEEMGLTGWVINNAQGVFIEAEAEPEVLQRFLLRIEREKPAISSIQSFEHSYLDPDRLRQVRNPREHWRGKDGADPARHCDLWRLPAGDFRSDKSSLPVSVHELHQLRTTIQHHRGTAVRSAANLNADF